MNFDKFTQNYKQIHNENIKISGESSDYFYEYKARVLSHLFSKYQLSKKIKLLDLGCGTGNVERYLYNYYPEAQVYGIDPSSESIRVASSTDKKTVYSVYDGRNILFENNYFDVVLLACVLHHILPAVRKYILDEVYRVLEKDGYLFIFEHNPLNPFTRRAVKTCLFDTDAHLLGRKECINISKKSKFSIIETKYIVFFPRILNFLRRFENKMGLCPFGAQYFVAGRK